MSGMPTTQQLRAKDAWDTATKARESAQRRELDWDEFDGQVKRLGPRIVTAGLGPALAFLAARERRTDDLLLRRISAWVLRKGDVTADLQQRIRDGNSDELRRWTAEALEWLVWVKRFCGAIEKDPL